MELTKEMLLHPETAPKIKTASLDGNPVYEKLLNMYEEVKDKEQNQVSLLLAGQTVLLSPKLLYLHLKLQTPLALHLTSLASAMEKELGI